MWQSNDNGAMDIRGPWRDLAATAGLLGPDGRPAETIFSEMTALAAKEGAVNLGQGAPDEDGPAEVLEAALAAIAGGRNQYAPGVGVPALREAIATHQRHWYGIGVEADREVIVTAGATEAIAATLLALVEPGDEIVAIEPYYDEYAALAGLTRGTLVTVPLRRDPDAVGGFGVDHDDLARAVTDRTRIIIVNTPHNPTGTLLPPDTLTDIVRLAERHDALIMTDEVYEHLAFGGQHVPIASLPGAADRTITISSAGKTFSTTGWKIGWLIARPDIAQAILAVKQFLSFSNGTPFQDAIALGLGLPDHVFTTRRDALAAKAARLADALEASGFDVVRPASGYFVCADASPLGARDSASFARDFARESGVAGIPLSAFCTPGSEAHDAYGTWMRFAFCKRDAVLDEAIARLKA